MTTPEPKKKQKPAPKKRGPKPDVLKIEEDPGEALDRLLGVKPTRPADDDSKDKKGREEK